jgi:ssDNA thymidine ADP-ribosyltransferase, DarT
MSVPNPVRLFHITAIDNLPQIIEAGKLLSKNLSATNGINYQNIAHQGAQGARAIRTLPNPPGGVVHDYVPFYFAPRSPMLSAIHHGRVAGCQLTQSDIVHFETTVEKVTAGGKTFAFYDRNATLQHSRCYTDLAKLNVVAWDLLTEDPKLDGFCKYWHDRTAVARYADRMERRQAEFLVRDFVPINQIIRIGVIDEAQALRVNTILKANSVSLSVTVMSDWYFLGQ